MANGCSAALQACPLGLTEAAQLLGIGRTSAYQMAAAGTFPVPVLRLGRSIRIPTVPLLELLGLSNRVPEAQHSSQTSRCGVDLS